MDVTEAAHCLDKLGNPTRLEIVRLLVRAGPDGLTVGEVQEHLGIPASTLSHHILHLVTSGLIRQQRQGRALRCSPNFELLRELIDMLNEECCSGVELPARQSAAG